MIVPKEEGIDGRMLELLLGREISLDVIDLFHAILEWSRNLYYIIVIYWLFKAFFLPGMSGQADFFNH